MDRVREEGLGPCKATGSCHKVPTGKVVGGRLHTGQEVLAYDCEHRVSEKETTVSGSLGEAAPPT